MPQQPESGNNSLADWIDLIERLVEKPDSPVIRAQHDFLALVAALKRRPSEEHFNAADVHALIVGSVYNKTRLVPRKVDVVALMRLYPPDRYDLSEMRDIINAILAQPGAYERIVNQ